MGSTIAKNRAILLLIAAVPVVFAMPVATCPPVGGELPGINCLPRFALAVLGPSLVAFFLGMMVAGGRRSGGWRPAIRAMAALACGGSWSWDSRTTWRFETRGSSTAPCR